MKKILSLICALVLLLTCIGPVPAKAAATDTMELSSVFLRSAEGKEGIFFGAYFNLSQDTLDNMARYGLALTPKTMADDDAWTAAMDASVQRSWYTTGLTADVGKEVQSTSLVNIINISNDSMTNNRNASTVIYVRPYVELQDGSFLYGDVGSITMKQVAQMVDAIYSSLTDTQKRGLLGMYERFTACMKGWGLTNIKADYPNGTDVNGESLILQYRRAKVVANMKAQTEVVWSVETADGQPFEYSRAATSNGPDNDSDSNVYTLYPGRVYVGIPYTHGSCNLDMFTTRATLKDGVYVFEDAHASLFNGGSTTGVTAGTGTYNMSRLGNDCWDAICWAYETVGSSVTADQTKELVESYGMYPVGEYDITPALTSKGLIEDPKSIYTALNESGDLQPMYRSYALMQPGDTLVNSDHSMMVTNVSVVYNDDNTINPTESKISFYDQSAGREKAQSLITDAFDPNNLTDQTSAHDTDHYISALGIKVGDPDTCQQCADESGYDPATGYFHTSHGQRTWTFEKTFVTEGYIPVAPKELTDPTCTPAASRISDSASSVDISGIYTGSVTSTYRISKITMEVFDASGAKLNSIACLGIQSGITSGFALTRFATDRTRGAYGSVLCGTPAVGRVSYTYETTDEDGNVIYEYTEDANGTYYLDSETGEYIEITGDVVAPDGATLYTKSAVTATTTWLEAPDLAEGEYSYKMTCVLGNGYTKTFREGYFVVKEGTNQKGETANLVLPTE